MTDAVGATKVVGSDNYDRGQIWHPLILGTPPVNAREYDKIMTETPQFVS